MLFAEVFPFYSYKRFIVKDVLTNWFVSIIIQDDIAFGNCFILENGIMIHVVMDNIFKTICTHTCKHC